MTALLSNSISKLAAVIGVGALLTGALTVPSAVSAAVAPEGDRFFVLPCEPSYMGHLFELDTLSGDVVRVGSWVRPTDADIFEDNRSKYECAGPGAYNPQNGLGYWISWAQPDVLISVNLSTGVNTVVDNFRLNGNNVRIYSLAIGPNGEAWVTDGRTAPSNLYSLNLETAEMTLVGRTLVEETDPAQSSTIARNNYGLAWNFVTNQLYAYNAFLKTLYTVNTSTGAFTSLKTDLFGRTFTPYAIAFDSSGQLWGINEDLASAPLGDLDTWRLLVVNDSRPGNFYTESLIVVPRAVVQTVSPVDPTVSPVDQVISNYFIARGFGKSKSKLTKSMRTFIEKEISSRSGEQRATCTGTVQGNKWTEKRQALALARAASACKYINTLSPALPFELKTRLIPKGEGDPLTARITVFY